MAKHFKLASVNIPPVHSKESRHIYAVIARGNYTRGVEFYADLVDTPSGNHEGAKHNHNAYIDPPPPDDESDVTVSDEPEVSTDSTDLWSDSIDSYGDSLSEIVEDLIGRLKQGDHNLLSGVTKFIKSYRKMANSSGDSAISYTLHNFGQSDSESLFYFILRMLECFPPPPPPPRKCVVKWTAWFLHKNQFYRDSEEEERLVLRHQNGTSRRACKKET